MLQKLHSDQNDAWCINKKENQHKRRQETKDLSKSWAGEKKVWELEIKGAGFLTGMSDKWHEVCKAEETTAHINYWLLVSREIQDIICNSNVNKRSPD